MQALQIIKITPFLAAIAIVIFNLGMSSCYYDNVDDLFPGGICDTTNVSFAEDIKPIVDLKCAIPGCHVAGGSGLGILTNYAALKAKIDDGSFTNRAIVQQDMPPAGSQGLNDCELNVIVSWVNAGAPNN